MSAPHDRSTRHRVGWWRRVDLNNAPALVVLLLALAALVYVGLVSQHWLRGVGLLGVAMCVGGAFRAVLPTRQAGLLAVRGRQFDTVCYLGLGVAILVLAVLLRHTA